MRGPDYVKKRSEGREMGGTSLPEKNRDLTTKTGGEIYRGEGPKGLLERRRIKLGK